VRASFGDIQPPGHCERYLERSARGCRAPPPSPMTTKGPGRRCGRTSAPGSKPARARRADRENRTWLGLSSDDDILPVPADSHPFGPASTGVPNGSGQPARANRGSGAVYAGAVTCFLSTPTKEIDGDRGRGLGKPCAAPLPGEGRRRRRSDYPQRSTPYSDNFSSAATQTDGMANAQCFLGMVSRLAALYVFVGHYPHPAFGAARGFLSCSFRH